MADYSMEDSKWIENVAKVNLYLETHDLGDMEQVIRWNLNQGDTDPDNRKRYWTSITTLFGMLPNNPFHSHRASDLPEEVTLAINKFATNYAEAYSASYPRGHLIGGILHKQGYVDAGKYRESLNQKMKSTLTTYFLNNLKNRDGPRWDGSTVDGIPQIKFEND
jgi:hypothetical protein